MVQIVDGGEIGLTWMLYFFGIKIFVFFARSGCRLDCSPFRIAFVCLSFLNPICQSFFVFRSSRCHENAVYAYLLLMKLQALTMALQAISGTAKPRRFLCYCLNCVFSPLSLGPCSSHRMSKEGSEMTRLEVALRGSEGHYSFRSVVEHHVRTPTAIQNGADVPNSQRNLYA